MTTNKNNHDLDKSFVSSQLQLTDYVLIYPALMTYSALVYNFLFSVFFLSILLFLIWGIYFIANAKNQDNLTVKEFKNVWSFLYDLNDKVILNPVVGISLANLSCFNDSTCYGPLHLLVIGVGLINFVSVLILQFLYAYVFFNFTFKIKDCLSRNPSNTTVLFFFARVVLVIF